MIRLHVIAEGQTEEAFVNQLLSEHLSAFDISVDVRSIETSRNRSRIMRGGMVSYLKVRKDLGLWIKQDHQPDSFFTTMFDLYALADDFPMFAEARNREPYQRVELLEKVFAEDIKHHFPNASRRFVPYIQLFEFEALLLSDPAKFAIRFSEYKANTHRLVQLCSSFESPELIDDNLETAPSKRIIKEIPPYAGTKASAGPLIAQQIGLPTIRQKCPHFNSWLTNLERLHETFAG